MCSETLEIIQRFIGLRDPHFFVQILDVPQLDVVAPQRDVCRIRVLTKVVDVTPFVDPIIRPLRSCFGELKTSMGTRQNVAVNTFVSWESFQIALHAGFH